MICVKTHIILRATGVDAKCFDARFILCINIRCVEAELRCFLLSVWVAVGGVKVGRRAFYSC